MNEHATDTETLLGYYRQMLLVRKAEEALAGEFAEGRIPGFIHLSIGQEAVAVGVCAALTRADAVASTHRGHGHALAKGMALDRFFGEVFGKETGICGGRSGSMHVADMDAGMLGANGIVGAGVPIALGSALAQRVRGTGGVTAAFFGDGALAAGVVHESLNIAALWRLPLLFVCENNGWAEFSRGEGQMAARVLDLARAFGVEAGQVDGNDVEAVAGAAARYVADLRAGRGPRLLECLTIRARGHFEGDPQRYRDEQDRAELRERDPLDRLAGRLRALGAAPAALERLEQDVAAQVGQAVRQAVAASEPTLASVLAAVYTPAGRS